MAFVVGLLSSCMTPEQPSDVVPSEAPAAVEPGPVKPSPPVPPLKPAVQPSIEPRAEFDPQQLVGLGEGEVTNLIGAPGEIRDEPPARVWRYAGDGCSVDVLFYFDLTLQQFRALTYRIEPEGQSEQAQKNCLGGIQEGQRGRAKR